jgi:hypothetical protein
MTDCFWTADYEPVAESGELQDAPEGSLTRPDRKHDCTLALRRACDREGQGTATVGRRERAGADKVGMLSGSKFKVGAICVEPQGRRVLGDCLPID